MDTFDMMHAKYAGMENATTLISQIMIHDACNCAMMVVASEMGIVRMMKRFFPSEN